MTMKLTLEFNTIEGLNVIVSVYKLILARSEQPFLKGEDGDKILDCISTILFIIDNEAKGPFNEGDGDFYTVGAANVEFAEGIALILAIKEFFLNYQEKYIKLDDYLK